MKPMIVPAALAMCLAACSANNESPAQGGPDAQTVENPAPAAVKPAPAGSSQPKDDQILSLEGLGDLRIGKPVQEGSTWAARGAQVPGSDCRTISSPDWPGVYAIVEDGAVRRITVGQRSDVKLVEAIGIGASEADVKAAFPGFREEPHKYEASPAKYLTTPGAERGGSALRFEIDGNGKVGLIHVGTMPVLGYVEGCA
ncbi:MAG: hypothetical protein KDE55_07305 [Novosphingobium sp.]|nr:hypothetical protein [Novosphingobium sp.]